MHSLPLFYSTSRSQMSVALSNSQWSLVMHYCKTDPKKAAVFAKKARDIRQETDKAQSVQCNLEISARGAHVEPKIFGLPIHEALHIGAPKHVIEALIKAHPEGLRKREMVMRRLPLHIAMVSSRRMANDTTLSSRSSSTSKSSSSSTSKSRSSSSILSESEQVVKMLMERYPDALMQGDNKWRTPLHYALLNGYSDEIIQDMIRSCPEAAKAQDKKGYTPLHIACQKGYSAVLIHVLLHYNSNAVLLVTTAEGFTAEHFCEKSKKYSAKDKKDVLQLLTHYRNVAENNFPHALPPSSVRYIV